LNPVTTRSAAETEAVGESLASAAVPGLSLFISGELGAGKTTFVRGFLRGLGWRGKVGSPTFTLIEPYEAASVPVYHFDLYRLRAPDELEAIGFRDYFDGRGVCVVEWPERAGALLAPPDLQVELRVHGADRSISFLERSETGRQLLRQAFPEGRAPLPA
jgi:tRNA threonylcarbamoyladenosine biosynthesis protein TsaE